MMRDDSSSSLLPLSGPSFCGGPADEPIRVARGAVSHEAQPERKSSVLEDVIMKCERIAGYEAASVDLERIEVNGNGIVLLHLVRPDGGHWLSVDGEVVRELSPRLDRSLPILSRLEDEIEEKRWEVLSYRPGRRVVLADSSTVIKGYRARRSTAAATRQRLAEAAARAPGSFRVPHLLGHCSGTSSLRFERIFGDAVTISAQSSENFFSVGCALRAFQECATETGDGEELAVFGARDELAVLDRWAEKTVYAKGCIHESWRRAREQLESQCIVLPPSELVLSHRDLHDRQLSKTSEGIALLDFDLACRAETALDPANLLAHLSLRALQRVGGAEEPAAQLCGQALLDGLDRSEDPGFWSRLRFYQATTFLRLALVYGFRPQWSELCSDLTELGRRCLAEMRGMP